MSEITEQSALEALVATQEITDQTRQLVSEMAADHRDARAPHRLETIVLTAATPRHGDQAGKVAASLGVLNPNPIAVRLGLAGGAATAAARALPLPPSSGVVLPIDVQDYELGADDPADLAAGDAVLFVIRFAARQPFFFGAA